MKSIKITSIIFALVVIFTACKKERISKQTEPKDYKSTKMRMNLYGKILEYTVKYSPSTNNIKVEGKDAVEAQKIIQSYPNACVLVENENEFRFFKFSKDYYDYLSTVKVSNRLSGASNLLIGCNEYKANVEFYLNSNQGGLLKTETIDYGCSTVQSFQMKQPCNDGTNNACNYYGTQNYPGIKNPWVGSSINDEISSIYFRWNNTQSFFSPYVALVLYQDINYGGQCIIFWSANSPYNSKIDNLKNYKINTLLKTWNDRTSSYETYMI
jgi:hypothetical protein